MDELSGLTIRMNDTISAILPKIAATITERTSIGGLAKIDLSTAENWLVRPELVALCKDAISQNLTASVSPENFASPDYQNCYYSIRTECYRTFLIHSVLAEIRLSSRRSPLSSMTTSTHPFPFCRIISSQLRAQAVVSMACCITYVTLAIPSSSQDHTGVRSQHLLQYPALVQ